MNTKSKLEYASCCSLRSQHNEKVYKQVIECRELGLRVEVRLDLVLGCLQRRSGPPLTLRVELREPRDRLPPFGFAEASQSDAPPPVALQRLARAGMGTPPPHTNPRHAASDCPSVHGTLSFVPSLDRRTLTLRCLRTPAGTCVGPPSRLAKRGGYCIVWGKCPSDFARARRCANVCDFAISRFHDFASKWFSRCAHFVASDKGS